MTQPLWQPKHPEKTQMWAFMQFAGATHQHIFSDYQALHRWSCEYPAEFWQTLCDFFKLEFDTPPTEIISAYEHLSHATWFKGASFNYAQTLLTRGKDTHPAIISITESGIQARLTYGALRQQVAQCAAGLKALGVTKGTRVAGFLPNTTYTVIAFLASASLGAIWSSCSPDFGVDAALDRLGQIEPAVLFISDGHLYHGKYHHDLDKAPELLAGMPSVKTLVVCPLMDKTDAISRIDKALLWTDFLKPANTPGFVSLPFDAPLYILFSSGTTGKPKCIIHRAGGVLLQHMKELGLHTDIRAHDNLLFYTTCGWMMWNWMISILSLGATLTLYEGAPNHPEPDSLFEILSREKMTVFGTSAKFLSTVEKAGLRPNQTFTLPHLRCILTTGSPLLPKQFDFVYQSIKSDIQLSSISGGTDIVSCFALGNPMLPVYQGELQCPGLGMSLDIFDDDSHSVRETPGELVCTKPFPSMPIGFWQDPDNARYKSAYFERFPNVWAHGDLAEITAHGGLIIYGRSDAVLNPGGIRIGTAEIYRQVETIPDILDSVVIAQNWEDDVRIVLFVQLREGHYLDDALQSNIRQTLRTHASPRHVPAKILQVPDIPKTISGKTVELAVRQTVHGKPVKNLQSLANPEALEAFKDRTELKT